MNKLAITTFALSIALAGAANAATKPLKSKHYHTRQPVVEEVVMPADRSETVPYTEMRVGDPRIVYHEIGTSGAQNGNTIVPFYDEPIRSGKPYEIRYDYAEFRDNADNRR